MPLHRTVEYTMAYQTYTLGNWYLALSDAASIAEDGDINAIIASEVVGFDGYTTLPIVYSTPTWDAVNQFFVAPATPGEFANGGTTSIQYQSALAIGCPTGHARKAPKAVTQSSFNGGTDAITITGHGYVDNNSIVFRVASGTIDTAINTALRYYILNATTNTFQLSLDQVNPINLNGDGAALDAYVIDRTIDESRGGINYKVQPISTTIAPGQSVAINYSMSVDTQA